jgi:tetratricopeptide (TPR) repeat protein
MKKLHFFIIFVFLMNFLYSNDKEIYLDLLHNNKLNKLKIHLEKWEKKDPKNPEMFIGYFNYYINKGSKSGVSIDKYPKGEQQLAITDPKTDEVIGYLNDTTIYNYDDIKNALIYINRGLSYSPNRLDMHFGKIHILGEIKDFKTQSQSLINLLELSTKNKNKWLWSDNEKISDAENFLLQNIQDYYSTWFNVSTEESMESVKKTASKQINLYPNNIFGYSNLAAYYIVKKDFNESLKHLIKAEKIDPNDIIIINNIAYCYKMINNKKMAKKYYNKMIQKGDKEAAEYAKKMLNEL